MTKRYAGDITGLGIVLVLGVLFYYPKTEPLHSRYMYYADFFERAAGYVSPEYTDFHLRHTAEDVMPLMTLLARYALLTFRDDPATAVTVLNVGFVLVAGALTFLTNRYYFSVLPSLYITVLLLFDRSLMPLARGLGLMGVLLLPPLLLIIIRSLSHTQRRNVPWRQQIVPIVFLAASGGLIYSLGGHETIYAVFFGLVFVGIMGAAWLVRSTRLRRPAPGPTAATAIGVTATVIFAIAIIAATCFGIPKEQNPQSFWKAFTYQRMMDWTFEDLDYELTEPDSRYREWKATFYDGKYHRDYGSFHENVFLYPGPGFNGMIPLFVLPGFLVGLWGFGRAIVALVWPRPHDSCGRSQRYFLILNLVFLVTFVGVALVSSDPKPTRYAPCIYSIFALSALGYQQLYNTLRHLVARRDRTGIRLIADHRPTAARVVAVALILVVGVFVVQRLHKNYNDLNIYCKQYRFQIATDRTPPLPLLEKAATEYASRSVYFVGMPIRFERGHPAVGLWLGYDYDFPENVTFLVRVTEETPIPDDAVVFVRTNSQWRQGDAAEFKR